MEQPIDVNQFFLLFILVEFTVVQGNWEAIEFAPLCKDWQTRPAALPKGQICRCTKILTRLFSIHYIQGHTLGCLELPNQITIVELDKYCVSLIKNNKIMSNLPLLSTLQVKIGRAKISYRQLNVIEGITYP